MVAQDIKNVTDIGVEIATNSPVRDLDALRSEGFDAVLVATGTPRSTSLGIPGEDGPGVLGGVEFLRDVRLDQAADLEGRRVVVVGGGNVAMDAARTARRLGAASVTVAYRRGREEMPAHRAEIEDAEREGVQFAFLAAPVEVMADAAGSVRGLRCTKMALGAPDASGRRRPEPIAGSEFTHGVRGRDRGDRHGARHARVRRRCPRQRQRHPASPTRRRSRPASDGIFAAGDVVTGPSDITRAVGEGRRAAFMIDRWLTGGTMSGFDDRLPVVDKQQVVARQRTYALRVAPPAHGASRPRAARLRRDRAAHDRGGGPRGAARCMDCAVCSECEECVKACPVPGCIDLHARDEELEVDVDAVVLATGFNLFPADLKPEYGYGVFKNVITGMQMDRLLAPTRPYNTILRPGDGKVPERIAYVMCTGSRDEQVGNPLCSRFCCMYSVKQNQLIMGALPLADVTVHYMDIRAAGKKYDEFYEQARAMGANYVKGRVAKITETPEGNLVLHYEDIENGGTLVEAEYDLVVLAVGVQPNSTATALFPEGALSLDEFRYIAEMDEDINPGVTSIPGVYVAGAASGAKDIAESIVHAGATVAQVSAHLERSRLETVEVPA